MALGGKHTEGNKISLEQLSCWILLKHPNGVLAQNVAEGLLEANTNNQEALMRATAKQTTKSIIEDLGNDIFGVHSAGFDDIERSDAVAVVLRYADKKGIA